MKLWEERVVPKITDALLSVPPVVALRRRVATDLHGTVLEVGFGSGLNAPHYPQAVGEVLAVEPLTAARSRAERRLRDLATPVRWVGLDGQAIPLPDRSVDSALSTFTLCTIPDASAALREIARLLRPGGVFHFLEHGLAASPAVQRWQHRFNSVEKALVGGCHLNRPIHSMIEDSGFVLESLEHVYVRGFPKPWGSGYIGTARVDAPS
jgi:ubiquinone/menaquinone biosynthesis C-methylase UbiE